ncbi:hypothetical protein [Methylocystis sp. Sn-Cys]|uniref:hypothetical protein n=1 Tax=Methylocystis sp. Sn-Cys TaxID=1701263 RepID=UPI001923DE35|nr:hypothetical protein [Methylocystis sp. Sn-Cys]MBL1258622.1 hypothetical protein [Methylocystis sp. Sn-Cys]
MCDIVNSYILHIKMPPCAQPIVYAHFRRRVTYCMARAQVAPPRNKGLRQAIRNVACCLRFTPSRKRSSAVRGSLAIWCDPIETEIDGHAPKIELHFNMWQDLPQDNAALDVGFRIKEARTIRQLHFYIPAEISLDRVTDLSTVLKNKNTISAIFNNVLKIGSENSLTYQVKNSNDKVYLRVVYIDFEKHLSIFHLKDGDNTDGTVLTFNDSLFQNLDEVGDYYIRLRLKFGRKELYKLFASKFDAEEKLFISVFSRTDIIEFRVNEKRNFSNTLRSNIPNMFFPDISAIHFLLARRVDVELIKSHADFRKMRKLEPNIWDHYLEQFGKVPSEMVIYHWREIAQPGASVDDFMALAIFRKFIPNFGLYALALALFGGLGSAVQGTLAALLKQITEGKQTTELTIQLSALVMLGLALLGLYDRIRKNRSENGDV